MSQVFVCQLTMVVSLVILSGDVVAQAMVGADPGANRPAAGGTNSVAPPLRQATTDANFYEVPAGSEHRFYRQSFALPQNDGHDYYLPLFEKPVIGSVGNPMAALEGTITATRTNGLNVGMSAYVQAEVGHGDQVAYSITNHGALLADMVEVIQGGKTWIALHWYADAASRFISTDLRVVASDFAKLSLVPFSKALAIENHAAVEKASPRRIGFTSSGVTVHPLNGATGLTIHHGATRNVHGLLMYGGATGDKLIAALSNTDGTVYAGWFRLWANGETSERIRISASPGYATFFNSGNVGIGTSAPETKLHVTDAIMTSGANGGFFFKERNPTATAVTWGWYAHTERARLYRGTASGYMDALVVDSAGNVTVFGGINAKYQDIAEWVPALEDIPAGIVVVLDRGATNTVRPSSTAYDTAVAGVVSAQPGLTLGEAGAQKEMVATTGRVRVRTIATRPVRVGDLLVTSDVAGTAMPSEPMEINGRKFHQPGTIIGKALEPLASGIAEILVLLSLQ